MFQWLHYQCYITAICINAYATGTGRFKFILLKKLYFLPKLGKRYIFITRKIDKVRCLCVFNLVRHVKKLDLLIQSLQEL